MKIGIWMNTGRQPPTGLWSCFFHSSCVACVRLAGSSLYFSAIAFISGWRACIFCVESACFRLTGNIAPRTMTVRRRMAIP